MTGGISEGAIALVEPHGCGIRGAHCNIQFAIGIKGLAVTTGLIM